MVFYVVYRNWCMLVWKELGRRRLKEIYHRRAWMTNPTRDYINQKATSKSKQRKWIRASRYTLMSMISPHIITL